MKTRLSYIVLFGLLAAVLSQCVSPLDPDTPRSITPNPDETSVLPPKSDTLQVSFRMDGILKRDWNPKVQIKNWPTFEMIPFSTGNYIKTAEEPYTFDVNADYRLNGVVDTMDIDQDDIQITAMSVHLDSLVLPMDSTALSLNREQYNHGNYLRFEVAYLGRGGQSINAVDTVFTDDDTAGTKAIILESTLRYAGYDDVEDTFTLMLVVRFELKTSASKYRYEGKITLQHDP